MDPVDSRSGAASLSGGRARFRFALVEDSSGLVHKGTKRLMWEQGMVQCDGRRVFVWSALVFGNESSQKVRAWRDLSPPPSPRRVFLHPKR